MAALAPALVSCSQPKAAVPAPAYPALGTVVKLADGEVRATGVVARYPVAGMGRLYSEWALYSSLGSETTSLGVIAMLEVRPGDDPHYGLSRDATTGALAAFDGKLVTVEGTMTPARGSYGIRGSSPWPQIALSSIATAPPEAQARVVWEGALVQPGMWFDEPWRYNLAHAYETLRTGPDSYYDLAAAEKAFGSPIPTPKSPLVGRLVGLTLSTKPRAKRPWMLAYSSGLVVYGPLMGTARPDGQFGALGADWIASTLKVKSSSNDRPVDLNGRPGLVGEMNGIGPAMTHYIAFWDGEEIVTIEYEGLGSGPSESDLLAIAASMSK